MSDSYKTYEVRVYANGTKQWFLGGKQLTEAEFNKQRAATSTCEDKVVLIDGVEYKLVRV